MTANGFIFYEGSSPIDGAPIVGIVTGTARGSKNAKTGAMCQAWILRSDIDPVAAVMSGKDRSICGDCQHRSGANVGRSCYVIWWLAPLQVYKAYKAGQYDRLVDDPLAQETRMHGHTLRIGAYGDPAMLPYAAWLPIARGSSGTIGYTQQWRTCDPMFARLLMASVQSRGEKHDAAVRGWRTFRTRPLVSQVLEDEVVCPASNEAGHVVTCEECQLCQGTTRRGAKSVAIIAHGQRVTWFAERPAEVLHGG